MLEPTAHLLETFEILLGAVGFGVGDSGVGTRQSIQGRLLDVAHQPLEEGLDTGATGEGYPLACSHTAEQTAALGIAHQCLHHSGGARQHLGRFADRPSRLVRSPPTAVVGIYLGHPPQRHRVVGEMVVQFDHAREHRVPGAYPRRLLETIRARVVTGLNRLDHAIANVDGAVVEDTTRLVHRDHAPFQHVRIVSYVDRHNLPWSHSLREKTP